MELGLRERLDRTRRGDPHLQPDRRVYARMPLHPRGPQDPGRRRAEAAQGGDRPQRGTVLHPQRQRARVHREGHPEVTGGAQNRHALHRSGLPVAERLRGKLQQPFPGGMPEPGATAHPERIACGLRRLARLLQQPASSSIPGLANASPICETILTRGSRLRSGYALPAPAPALLNINTTSPELLSFGLDQFVRSRHNNATIGTR